MCDDKSRLVLGIDGGGTKTEFCVCDDCGYVKKRFTLSACNPNTVGFDECTEVLLCGIENVLSAIGDISYCFAGIAGCGSSDNAQKVLEVLSGRFPRLLFNVKSDIENVFGCLYGCEKAVAAILGTGSVVYAKCGNELHRAAGYGYLFDGSGSGYDIGRACIRRCLMKDDGLCEESLLTRETEKVLGTTAHEKLADLYRCGKNYIASFAPIVFECAGRGDTAAADILKLNFEYVKNVIDFVRTRYDCGDTVILAGGLTKNEGFVRAALCGSYNIIVPKLPPVFGACANAAGSCAGLNEIGFDFDGFSECFEKTYISQPECEI